MKRTILAFATLLMGLAGAAKHAGSDLASGGAIGRHGISFLTADPHNNNKIYLGTADGHVFTSTDDGGHWALLSRIGTGQDDVVTHIIVDPRDANRLYASTWALYSGGRRRISQR